MFIWSCDPMSTGLTVGGTALRGSAVRISGNRKSYSRVPNSRSPDQGGPPGGPVHQLVSVRVDGNQTATCEMPLHSYVKITVVD